MGNTIYIKQIKGCFNLSKNSTAKICQLVQENGETNTFLTKSDFRPGYTYKFNDTAELSVKRCDPRESDVICEITIPQSIMSRIVKIHNSSNTHALRSQSSNRPLSSASRTSSSEDDVCDPEIEDCENETR